MIRAQLHHRLAVVYSKRAHKKETVVIILPVWILVKFLATSYMIVKTFMTFGIFCFTYKYILANAISFVKLFYAKQPCGVFACYADEFIG